MRRTRAHRAHRSRVVDFGRLNDLLLSFVFCIEYAWVNATQINRNFIETPNITKIESNRIDNYWRCERRSALRPRWSTPPPMNGIDIDIERLNITDRSCWSWDSIGYIVVVTWRGMRWTLRCAVRDRLCFEKRSDKRLSQQSGKRQSQRMKEMQAKWLMTHFVSSAQMSSYL